MRRIRHQTTTPRERAARALLRRHFRCEVESVSMLRQRNDGEFAALVVWPPHEAAGIVAELLDPRNTTLEITRIHLGQHGRDARIYVRFDDPPRPARTQPEIDAEWDRIEAALAGQPEAAPAGPAPQWDTYSDAEIRIHMQEGWYR